MSFIASCIRKSSILFFRGKHSFLGRVYTLSVHKTHLQLTKERYGQASFYCRRWWQRSQLWQYISLWFPSMPCDWFLQKAYLFEMLRCIEATSSNGEFVLKIFFIIKWLSFNSVCFFLVYEKQFFSNVPLILSFLELRSSLLYRVSCCPVKEGWQTKLHTVSRWRRDYSE